MPIIYFFILKCFFPSSAPWKENFTHPLNKATRLFPRHYPTLLYTNVLSALRPQTEINDHLSF